MNYQQKLIILPVRIRREDTTLNITAYEAEGTGLAYHAQNGDERDGWVITHMASKKALCTPIGTEHEVKLLLERVAGITDWQKPEKELTQPKIANDFRACQKSVRQELNMQLESAAKTCMPDHLVDTIMHSLDDDVLRSALLYAFKIVPSHVGV